jgi:hypothetical protein
MSTKRRKSPANRSVKSRRRGNLTTSRFEALPDTEKERIYREIDGKSTEQLVAESKPLTPAQRARWNRVKKNLGGRPKLGKFGTAIVSITVERELLRKADAFAKAKGLKRSELFTRGVRLAMGANAA